MVCEGRKRKHACHRKGGERDAEDEQDEPTAASMFAIYWQVGCEDDSEEEAEVQKLHNHFKRRSEQHKRQRLLQTADPGDSGGGGSDDDDADDDADYKPG